MKEEIEEVEIDESNDPIDAMPLWFEQFRQLDEKKRKLITMKIMEQLHKNKPDAFRFIKRFKCVLVGVTPRIVYSLISSKDEDLETVWIHAFSMATLLFWCKEGKFGFFVNPVMDYNDTILNKIDGNKKQELKGFTG